MIWQGKAPPQGRLAAISYLMASYTSSFCWMVRYWFTQICVFFGIFVFTDWDGSHDNHHHSTQHQFKEVNIVKKNLFQTWPFATRRDTRAKFLPLIFCSPCVLHRRYMFPRRNKSKCLVVWGIFRGWHPIQLYGDYFINQYIRIPLLNN